MMFRYPVNYIGITTYYEEGVHKGIDLGWSELYGMNQPIYAAGDGVVTDVKKDVTSNTSDAKSYGNYIEITHSSGVSTFYAHLKYDSICVNVGDSVKMGDKIALMGDTGYAFGNHLHFELRIDNKLVDPMLYTYVYNDQVVASDPVYKKNILYYNEDNKDIEILREEIARLEKENELLRKELNYSFKYDVTKTSYYKIKLYEGEKLYIK